MHIDLTNTRSGGGGGGGGGVGGSGAYVSTWWGVLQRVPTPGAVPVLPIPVMLYYALNHCCPLTKHTLIPPLYRTARFDPTNTCSGGGGAYVSTRWGCYREVPPPPGAVPVLPIPIMLYYALNHS